MNKPLLDKIAGSGVARSFSLILMLTCLLAWGAVPAPAQQPTTVTLSTTAIDPVHGPFSVTALFGAPVTTLTATHLALTNAMASGLKALTVQNSVAGGFVHSVVLKADGTVVAWGENAGGQCDVPAGLANVAAIAAGGRRTLALKTNGTVVAWGDHSYNACNVPLGLTGVVAIAAGYWHNLALKANGTVVAWGGNLEGQCNIPAGLAGVVAIAAGNSHSLALKADGTVVAWGYNVSGQCNVPAGLAGVTAIASGGGPQSLALKADGTVVAWGYTAYGNVPVDLGGVVAITGGYYHRMALKSDGTVVAWGLNDDGQCNMPAGLKASLPGLTRYLFTVKPLELGPITVQVPAGVVTTLDGVSNAASNILQLNSLVPVALSSFGAE